MPSFLQNKYVKYSALAILALIVLSFLWVLLNLFSGGGSMGSTGLGGGSLYAPSASMDYASEKVSLSRGEEMDSSFMPIPPAPSSGGYTSDLEKYETTTYAIFGRTKEFDLICEAIKILKANDGIHFKNFTESTNNCSAVFFVEENQADGVAASLRDFNGIEQNRNTSSVSRHRQQIESRTSILIQQIANVEKTLVAAEAQLVNINNALATNVDASNLSIRVTESLRLIDELTQRKINLNSQLSNLYQQAADLEERLGVVEFSTNISRSNPIYPNEDSRAWEVAWDELSDAYRETLIALSATFLVFLLWTLRVIVYLLVVTIVLRILYRFGKLVVRKF